MTARRGPPRHPVSCRRFSKDCCQDFQDVMNRKFRRDNRRHPRERSGQAES